MWYWWFIGGFFLGLLIESVIIRIKKKDGTLRIDTTNPEKDIYRLEIDNLDVIPKKKQLVLRVDSNSFLTQD